MRGHIDQEEFEPIRHEEWIQAVQATPGIRFVEDLQGIDAAEITARFTRWSAYLNVAVEVPPGPILKLFGAKTEWPEVFGLASFGQVSFRAHTDLDNPNDPVRRAAASLSRQLGARIFGDDGEEYNW